MQNNTFSNSHLFPDLGNDIGKLFIYKFWFSSPQIVWDGIKAPNYMLNDGAINPDYRICVSEDERVKVAVLDAANDFADLSSDPAILKCDL